VHWSNAREASWGEVSETGHSEWTLRSQSERDEAINIPNDEICILRDD
jgi:hypothetical protein